MRIHIEHGMQNAYANLHIHIYIYIYMCVYIYIIYICIWTYMLQAQDRGTARAVTEKTTATSVSFAAPRKSHCLARPCLLHSQGVHEPWSNLEDFMTHKRVYGPYTILVEHGSGANSGIGIVRRLKNTCGEERHDEVVRSLAT